MHRGILYSDSTFHLNKIEVEGPSTCNVGDKVLHDPVSWIRQHVNGEGNEVLAIISSTFLYSDSAIQNHALASVRSSDDKHIPTLLLNGRFGGAHSAESKNYNQEAVIYGDDFKSMHGDFSSTFFISEVLPQYIGEKLNGSAMEPSCACAAQAIRRDLLHEDRTFATSPT